MRDRAGDNQLSCFSSLSALSRPCQPNESFAHRAAHNSSEKPNQIGSPVAIARASSGSSTVALPRSKVTTVNAEGRQERRCVRCMSSLCSSHCVEAKGLDYELTKAFDRRSTWGVYAYFRDYFQQQQIPFDGYSTAIVCRQCFDALCQGATATYKDHFQLAVEHRKTSARLLFSG